jgi:hypothetical protein
LKTKIAYNNDKKYINNCSHNNLKYTLDSMELWVLRMPSFCGDSHEWPFEF